ncbi:MAG TPA: sulfur carrier protein ThiS adenylyltransferase ThiF [Geopsychrobacteraceae bacterium]|jgi:sulfur carrier protein ThiS adenylyltransferase
MKIFLNEREISVAPDTTLHQLRRQQKTDADLLIVNGFPRKEDTPLCAGDRVVLIKRGEQPSAAELEALMMSRHTPGVHAKIRKSVVGIAGAGGLGSNIAVALARIGVGRLIIVDFDLVEPSNLNRQQYFIDQIGQPKVAALRDNLHRINPLVDVQASCARVTPENIAELFGGVDVLTEAFDAAAEKTMLISGFLSRFPETPLVAASGLAGYGPSNTIVTEQVARHLYIVGDGCSAAQPGQGLMAPRVGIAAHHQANAVLRLLLGEEPA